jgi:amino-acid N-acetyltransferase
MSDVHIRPAIAADQANIKQMVRDEYLDPSALDWSHFLVAEMNGDIVGIGQVRPYLDCHELGSLVVKKPYRGTGLGAKLVNALLERESGDVYLECQAKNETYYNRFGFHKIPKNEAPTILRRKNIAVGLIMLVLGIKIIIMKRENTLAAK